MPWTKHCDDCGRNYPPQMAKGKVCPVCAGPLRGDAEGDWDDIDELHRDISVAAFEAEYGPMDVDAYEASRC
jgi:hypothetical protein